MQNVKAALSMDAALGIVEKQALSLPSPAPGVQPLWTAAAHAACVNTFTGTPEQLPDAAA